MASGRMGYSGTAKFLHWLTVLVLVVQYTLGWLMPHLRRNTVPAELNNLHMSFGFVVLAVIALRLFFRLKDGAPRDEPTLAGWERQTSHLVHWLLYVAIVAFVLTGWIFASGHGYALSFFGYFPIPPIAPAGASWARSIGEFHQLFVWPVIVLAAVHVLAALWHHFIKRDGVLLRMLPGSGRR